SNVAISEFAIPTYASGPVAIVKGGSDLWFTEDAASKIGSATESGQITEFPITTKSPHDDPLRPRPELTTPPSGFGPNGIALGYDNALWFTEDNASAVGRMTLAGKMSGQYRVDASCCLQYIHKGPGKALWFAASNPAVPEAGADEIARINIKGAVTAFKFRAATPIPGDVAEGPDGAIWFTQYTAGKIGRMTPAGKVTNEYTTPTKRSSPSGIVEGPDHALWFTEVAANKIGRITTTGKITEYPVPTAKAGLSLITRGPSGALWFTEFYANQIGEITVTGKITEYAVPTYNSEPLGIAADGKDTIWFTEHAGNNIGRLVVSGG
ncbi:MAG TPA: hypothetical protein VMF61_10135, partial [Candidatus Acidoferrales bacterium]|nr:hypothetical protein [Candidatus Acidoferrales bacterium]